MKKLLLGLVAVTHSYSIRAWLERVIGTNNLFYFVTLVIRKVSYTPLLYILDVSKFKFIVSRNFVLPKF